MIILPDSDQCSLKYSNKKVSSLFVIKSSIISKPEGNLDDISTNSGTVIKNVHIKL